MKRIKYNEGKYLRAVKDFVEQTVAMAQEDCTDEDTGKLDEESVYERALEYMGEAQVDFDAKLNDLME